jgi:hypothetical protein
MSFGCGRTGKLSEGDLSVYSVEKLRFGAEAIFQFSEKVAENPGETRRTAG